MAARAALPAVTPLWRPDAKHRRLIRELHAATDAFKFDRAAELASRLQISQAKQLLTGGGDGEREPQPRMVGLTIVVQYYKHPGSLYELVSRLQHVHAEVIVHADSSTPSDEVAFEEVCSAFPSTRVVRSSNVHEVRAYNKVVLGERLARGDVVVFTQDDRLPPMDPKWIDTVMHTFRIMPRHFAALSLHRGNAYVVRSKWRDDFGQCLDVSENLVPTRPQRGALAFAGSVMLGPIAVRKQAFVEVGGFNTTYSPRDPASGEYQPGIKFDQEFAARLWARGYQVGVACASKATFFYNACGGSMTSASKAKRQRRWAQAALNSRLLRETYDGYLEGAILEQVREAQQRLEANAWLSHQLRKTFPSCILNCSAEPARTRRIFSKHDKRMCALAGNRTHLARRQRAWCTRSGSGAMSPACRALFVA